MLRQIDPVDSALTRSHDSVTIGRSLPILRAEAPWIAPFSLPGRFTPEVGLSLPKAGVFAAAQGRVVAERIAAHVLGRPVASTFDGAGYCFLETGAGRAVRADGHFFARPHPVMQARTPDEAQRRDKADWIDGLLQPRR